MKTRVTRIALAVLLPVGVSLTVLACAGARAQDKGDASSGGARADATAATGSASTEAPDPNQPRATGERLPDNSVKRDDLFPLDAGRRWVYTLRTWLASGTGDEATANDLKNAPRTFTEEVEVGPSQDIASRTASCLSYKLAGEQAQLAYYFVDGNHLVCPRRVLGSGDHKHTFDLDPPQATLDGTLAVGSSWTWTGKVGPTEGELHVKVLWDEKIQTPAGPFDTVVIQSTFTGNDDSTGASIKWLAPGVGIVREITEVKADQQLYRTEAMLTETTPATGGH